MIKSDMSDMMGQTVGSEITVAQDLIQLMVLLLL